LAQYRELEAFAQFGSDLDAATKRQLERGKRLEELLKQPQYSPVVVEKQVVQIYAMTKGWMDDVKVESIQPFTDGLLEYIEQNAGDLYTKISEEKMYDDAWEEKIKETVEAYKTIADKEWFLAAE
jgi:F-type H+-transporting ATPase subunit alpha